MADGDITLKIAGERAERLKAAAHHAGKSVEDYALGLIDKTLDQDWDWDAIERICDETQRGDAGVSWANAKAWMQGIGKSDGPPRPR